MEKAPASKPFVQQNIFEPRYIKWDSFSDLPYEFEELFTFQGWMEFSELNEYYYPYLIQEFYGSMKEVVKGESFSVRVKKKSQIIDVDFLASVLNLPNDGNRIGTFKDSRKLEGYDEKAFQLSIFPEGTPENEMTNISLVPQNFRILQSFIRYLLNPRVMDMLINRLDRQEWFMKKMAQMLFGESFGKFGDFGSYPQGTAGPSNAKAAGPSGVKISEVEEEEEEHVEAAEKVQEESKLAEVEEVEKNDEKEKSAEEASETEQEPTRESRESSSSLQATAAVTMEKVKAEMVQDKKRRRKSSHKTHPLNNQTLNQPSLYPCNTDLEEPKHKPENQFYLFLQKSKYP
ncbi:hypothetical protein GH714_004085 [Hevea brasiliensis]|uniref:Uncharacterized protein n=1 Tax=Hevea brasiliensis TaxID=3981 RepID=A0A6A6LV92_HEVBR|nr:hypothetical protein GH714_004085 [Hevea brasiliensis]